MKQKTLIVKSGILAVYGGEDVKLFAFFIGMTSSVSDVQIRSRDMRWMTMLHGIISFIFNLLILSICINLIAGSLEMSSAARIGSVSHAFGNLHG